MPRECGGTCYVSSTDVKVNPLAGYPICAGLQPLLAYAPHYPEHRGGNATERGRNRHIAVRAGKKKPGREGRVLFWRAGEKPEPEKAKSIFGDDRRGSKRSEFVAEPELNLVFGQVMIEGE